MKKEIYQKFAEGDQNVVCLYCKKPIMADDLKEGKCGKCGVDFRVEFWQKAGKIGALIDEKLSQWKRKK